MNHIQLGEDKCCSGYMSDVYKDFMITEHKNRLIRRNIPTDRDFEVDDEIDLSEPVPRYRNIRSFCEAGLGTINIRD